MAKAIVVLVMVFTAFTSNASSKIEERRTVKLPVNAETEITTCAYAGQDCPCTKLTVKYEDGSKETRIVAISPKGKWKDVLDALGDAMDKLQADHSRILRERRGK